MVLVVCIACVAVLSAGVSFLRWWLPDEEAARFVSGSLTWAIAIVGPLATLVLLLRTRIVGLDVRSTNNRFFALLGRIDETIPRGRCDGFIQKVCMEAERARGQ